MSDRADQLHQDLLDRVTQLRSSGEWLQAMTAAARFHDYSLGNWLLLWSQAEQRGTEVTRPAGYRTWQSMGRQVRRGERGFQILAPITPRITRDDTTDEERERVVCGFRVVHVFDIRQTEGEPLPVIGPRRLTGDSDARLLEAGIGMIEESGYRYGLDRLRGPNGLTRPGSKQVVVDADLDGAQLTKTTIHELAHVLMHADDGEVDCRGRVEVEAESVAYVVCAAAGLDTSSYSIPYVAGWADATANPEETLLRTGERIVATARRVLAVLERSQAFTSSASQISSSPLEMSLDSNMMTRSDLEPVGTAGKEWR
jgi:antirestriction protein ArdC